MKSQQEGANKAERSTDDPLLKRIHVSIDNRNYNITYDINISTERKSICWYQSTCQFGNIGLFVDGITDSQKLLEGGKK